MRLFFAHVFHSWLSANGMDSRIFTLKVQKISQRASRMNKLNQSSAAVLLVSIMYVEVHVRGSTELIKTHSFYRRHTRMCDRWSYVNSVHRSGNASK